MPLQELKKSMINLSIQSAQIILKDIQEVDHDHIIKAMCVHWQRNARPFLKIITNKGRYELCFERGIEWENVEDMHTGIE